MVDFRRLVEVTVWGLEVAHSGFHKGGDFKFLLATSVQTIGGKPCFSIVPMVKQMLPKGRHGPMPHKYATRGLSD